MAGKAIDGDGISASLAGMSKNQLYDIMCQMKASQPLNSTYSCFLLFFSFLFFFFPKSILFLVCFLSKFSLLPNAGKIFINWSFMCLLFLIPCADTDWTEPATSEVNSHPKSSLDESSFPGFSLGFRFRFEFLSLSYPFILLLPPDLRFFNFLLCEFA